MNKSLLQILFLSGVIPLELSGPRKYYLIQNLETWSNAAAYCQDKHTDLATIRSDDDMAKLQREVDLNLFKYFAWIGLHRFTHSWRWSYENETLGTLTNWSGTGPVNNYGIEDCGMISPTDRNASNIRYIYISAAKMWPQAQEYCRNYYTDLASARDATESEVIQSMIDGWTWFGLFKFTWAWSDQTNVYKNVWFPGRPLNYKTCDCALIYKGQAIDDYCTNLRPFLCYSVITGQRQIIRLKIQSDRDVNEPEVMEKILEKIQQKLKGHGVKSVKLN